MKAPTRSAGSRPDQRQSDQYWPGQSDQHRPDRHPSLLTAWEVDVRG